MTVRFLTITCAFFRFLRARHMHAGKGYLFISLLGIWSLFGIAGHAAPTTSADLNGRWDCRTTEMNQGGRPGAGLNLKPHSLIFTFSNGMWTMEGNGATQTTKSGTYEVHGTHLVLKDADGSKYQDWQAELSNDGQSLRVQDKKLIEVFEKMPPESK